MIGDRVESNDSNYGAPQIVDYGDLQELTAAAVNGKFTDALFTAHTPIDSLTFTNTP
jgi:hypothetical protein